MKNKNIVFTIGENERETLLSKFIKEKIKNYREPQRSGTPKGVPVGFSRKKYRASLLMMMTRFKQKDIASSLGVSFGTLRNWTTQDSFKEAIVNHCDEYVKLLKKHVKQKVHDKVELHKDHTNGITDKKPPIDSWKEFGDSSLYIDYLIDKIEEYEKEVTEKMKQHFSGENLLIFNFFSSFNIFLGYNPKLTDKKQTFAFKRKKEINCIKLIEVAEAHLKKDVLTKTSKIIILRILSWAKSHLG